jgi:hypothetical protein
MKKLENLRWQGRWVTDLACLKSCMDYLGIDVSDGWLYGASGHAFALNIHEELCPSGPTAWKKGRIYELAENLGCKIRTLMAFKGQKDFTEQQKAAWEEVKKAIDEGLPCYGWELDIPEYYVINGYDGDDYLYSGCTQQQGTKAWKELGDTGIGMIEVHIVSPAESADDEKATRRALGFAIEHTKEPEKYTLNSLYKCGLNGYDQWIKALDNDRINAGGMEYNVQVWAECRQNAFAFLKEAKERMASNGNALFDEVIGCFEVIAQEFSWLQEFFVFNPNDYDKQITDRQRLNEAKQSLQKARQAEAEALAEFERIVDAL